jgi:hypothetical protein
VNESALNSEVRLPRQVRERGEKARALLTPNPDEPVAPVSAESPPPPAAVETPTPPPADTRENDVGYWRHRFNVTEGMWKAEKVRFNEKVSALQQELQAAHARVRELEMKGTASEDVDLSTIFTAEEVETLGEDQARIQARAILQQARRIAGDVIQREVEPLRKQRLDEIEETERERQTAFLRGLTKEVPHWKEVNADPRWLAFLETEDDATGIWRQAIVDNAQDKGDFMRVANLIRQWEKTFSPVPVPDNPPLSVEGRSGGDGGNPPPPAPARGYPTKQEIRDFYKRKAINRISDSEIKEFEARMNAARAAGYM